MTLQLRPVGAPFFNYTKCILKYALTSKDSLITDLQNFGDSLLFSLTIYSDKQVEFHGNPVYNKNPYGAGKEISKYDIWINKITGLPYKYRRIMSHQTSRAECKDVQINKASIGEFVPLRYFPPDFAIVYREEEKPIEDKLTGTIAPDWTLSDYNNKKVSLKALKNKVLLIQFTGIGCGPCHASINSFGSN